MTAPALSSTIARYLLGQSPSHAWWNSRLNPAYQDEHRQEFDLGTAAHDWILEGRTDRFMVIDAADYRGKVAKEAREGAYADGKVPLLVHQYARMVECVKTFWDQAARFEDRPKLLDGPRDLCAEQKLEWIEEGVRCSGRLDWLNLPVIEDLKTVSGSAHPDQWGRNIWSSGYDVQAAFYRRAVKVVHGVEADFRFLVLELEPPYALSVVGLEPEALEIAERKRQRAVRLWKECLDSGQWPGYPTRTAYVEMPPWERTRWEASEMLPMEYRTPVPADPGGDIGDALFGDRT